MGFPRLQTLVVLAGCLAAWGLLLVCSLGLAVQAWFLWLYLPVAPQAVPTAVTAPRPADRLRILVINVLMTNRQDARLRQLVTETQPNVLLALEPDAWWAQALRPL